MTGLDAILAKIIEDAEQLAASRRASAGDRAALLESEHIQRATQAGAARSADAEKQAQKIRARGQSTAKTYLRNAALAERNRLIDEVIEQAFQSLADVSAQDAFARIESFAKSCPIDCPAILILCARDLERLPVDFAARMSAAIAQPITVRPEPGDFSFGCVVVIGEVEYNGTAEGILYDRRDEMRDKVNAILFANSAEGES